MSHIAFECPFCHVEHGFSWKGMPWTVGEIPCECGAKFSFAIHSDLGVRELQLGEYFSEGDSNGFDGQNGH